MAIVPKSQGPSVSTNPIANIQQGNFVTADVFGAKEGQALEQLGGKISDYTKERQKQDDFDALTKAEAELNELEFQMAHDPENGFFNKRGQNAIGGSKKILDDYSKRGSDIFSQLQSRAQRESFNRLMAQRTGVFSRSLARHEATQKDAYTGALTAAAIETAKLNAIADPLNEEYVQAAEKRILGYHNANINGLPMEAVSLAKRKDLSELHYGRMQRAIDTNPAQAQAIFNANKDKLLPSDFTRAKKMVEQGTLDNTAMFKSDEIVLNHENYSDQINEARKIKDAKLRDQVLGRIDRRYAQDKRAQSEANESAAEDALSLIDEGKTYDDLPVKLRLALPDNDASILRNYSDEKAGIRQSNPIKRLEKYDEIMSVYEKTPAKLNEYSLPELHANLDGANLEKVLKARRSGGQTTVKASERHFGQFVDKALSDRVISKADKPVFRLKLEEEISGIEDYTFQDIQSAYDRLTTKITFDGSGWFDRTDVYGFELEGDENADNLVVPEEERSKIIEAFERRGFALTDITDDMILKAFAQKTGLNK